MIFNLNVIHYVGTYIFLWNNKVFNPFLQFYRNIYFYYKLTSIVRIYDPNIFKIPNILSTSEVCPN